MSKPKVIANKDTHLIRPNEVSPSGRLLPSKVIHETDSILMKEAKQSRIDAKRKAKEWLKNDLKNNAKITFFFTPNSKKITQAETKVLENASTENESRDCLGPATPTKTQSTACK